ncbi:DUF1287 domain-containing protein [Enterovirga rhinocerotis]|uniref:DUF1287 domain-containing protein n=1 Tax=Enterovirga rhinocerotis TaxID=1339210 RepID=A0A4R7BR77_9HYPH|nr:DUF1287 domain-containing protein [Enterovirga rhinocerotis]TDR87282.1 hypothetical protein EV668_4362 [Enterovirga rhinocerotis]
MILHRRSVLFGLAGLVPSLAAADEWSARLVAAAQGQVGVTTIYDPAYVRLDYPGGDVPRARGVCTDVVIRAYRDAFAVDLQKFVHEDMRSAFAAYPKIWGQTRPDRNIDHRRVPNLETFFSRRRAALPVSETGADYRPGDLVTQRLPGNLPHIAIVTARTTRDGKRPLLAHNIGSGTQVEDILFSYRIVGHYRWRPAA